MSATTTRRTLLAGAASTALLAHALPAGAQRATDVSTLAGAVQLELGTALTYRVLAARLQAPRDAAARALLEQLAGQERQHAEALLRKLEYRGGLPPPAPTVAQAERILPQLRTIHDGPGALALALSLEQFEIKRFLNAQLTLDDAQLFELTAAVMCGDAQHLALVREQLGRNAIPSPFEDGLR